jgi:hypothetical protein
VAVESRGVSTETSDESPPLYVHVFNFSPHIILKYAYNMQNLWQDLKLIFSLSIQIRTYQISSLK